MTVSAKIRPVWRLGLLAGLVLGGAVACERGLTSAPGAEVADHETGSGSISGRILGHEDIPIAGARITTPDGASAISGPGGEFVLGGLPATHRLAVTVSAQGYASTTAVYRVVAGATLSREIHMLARGPRVRLDAAAGGVVAFADGGRVTIPPNAFEGVRPGEFVEVQVTYYDPGTTEGPAALAGEPVTLASHAGDDLDAAPGDFSAVEADGTASVLETAGMVDVFVTNSAGAQVNLAAGQVVVINFPDRDGPASRTWGLYEFDTRTGQWVRRGDAPADADGTLSAVVPSLNRPWNADDPLIVTCITVTTLRPDGTARPNELVSASWSNWIRSDFTGASGSVDLLVEASAQATVSAGNQSAVITTPAASSTCTQVATFIY